MAEETSVITVKLNQKSVFKIKDFYTFLYNTINNQGFTIFEDEFSSNGPVVSFEWSCEKKVDDYIKYKLWLSTKITKEKDVVVKRGEISEPMIRAQVEFKLKGIIVTDWQNRWETNPFVKFLKAIYDRYLYKSTFDLRKKKLVEIVNLIENEVKSFFELPRFL